MRTINLASQPFLNKRPVVRVAIALWLLAGGVLLTSIWLFGDFLRATQVNRARLAELQQSIAAEQDSIRLAESKLGSLNLDLSNYQASFLNQLIERRAFPWNRLFDDLESVIPKDVLLEGVKPELDLDAKKRRGNAGNAAARTAGSRTSRSPRNTSGRNARNQTSPVAKTTKPEKSLVGLELEGMARSDEALLDFVDILYSHPAFSSPLLSSESRDETGMISFRISVEYDTGAVLDAPFVLPPALGGPARTAEDGAGEDSTLAENFDAAGEPSSAGGAFGMPGTNPSGGAGNPGLANGASRGSTRGGAAPTTGNARAGVAPSRSVGDGAGSRGGRTVNTAPPSAVYGSPGFVPPAGGAGASRVPGTSRAGAGVVPPRNLPTGLNPSQSATPQLRSGG